MGCNNGWGGNCLWIIIIILFFCCGNGCGNSTWNNSCGCGCGNSNWNNNNSNCGC